jgi:hypothetical protein
LLKKANGTPSSESLSPPLYKAKFLGEDRKNTDSLYLEKVFAEKGLFVELGDAFWGEGRACEKYDFLQTFPPTLISVFLFRVFPPCPKEP